MKKLLLSLIICFSMSQLLLADLGSCLVYEAKFYLNDGTFFNGSIEIAGYGEMSYINEDGLNEFTSDDGILVLIKLLQKSNYSQINYDGGIQVLSSFNKVIVFKKIEEVPIRGMKNTHHMNHYESKYGFVKDSDIVYLDSSDIDKVIFWDAKYVTREWLTSEIVIAPDQMIKTVQAEQYWNRITLTENPNDEGIAFTENNYASGIEMINYNSNNNNSELKRLAKLKLTPIWDWEKYEKFLIKKYSSSSDNYPQDLKNRVLKEYQERHFQELRNWFWNRGIVILKIWDTC